MLTALLFAFALYATLWCTALFLYRRYRQRRSAQAWVAWRRRQQGKLFAWRMLFGSLPVQRLTDDRATVHLGERDE